MQAKCILCGKVEEVTKLHKDFRKLKENPNAVYYCDACSLKLSSHAARDKNILGKK